MSEDHQDLPALLARVRQRDEAAARALVERLHPLVARIVRTHLPRGEDEADLRQEVFLKVFSRIESFGGERPFDEFIALARRGASDGDLAAMPGFATRLAARWAHAPRAPGWLALWERAVGWGAAATLAVCLITVWFCRADFSPTTRAADTFAAFAELDEDDDATP
jgi:hypothetical protein